MCSARGGHQLAGHTVKDRMTVFRVSDKRADASSFSRRDVTHFSIPCTFQGVLPGD